MTCLARGLKCGALGARGLFRIAPKFSRLSMEANASQARPPPARCNISRRETGPFIKSVLIRKFIQPQYNLAEIHSVVGFQKCHGFGEFGLIRLPPERQQEAVFHFRFGSWF